MDVVLFEENHSKGQINCDIEIGKWIYLKLNKKKIQNHSIVKYSTQIFLIIFL